MWNCRIIIIAEINRLPATSCMPVVVFFSHINSGNNNYVVLNHTNLKISNSGLHKHAAADQTNIFFVEVQVLYCTSTIPRDIFVQASIRAKPTVYRGNMIYLPTYCLNWNSNYSSLLDF